MKIMIKQLLLAILFRLLAFQSLAQVNVGPKLLALGMNTGSVTDSFNTHGNPAMITATEQPTIAFSHLQFLMDNELSEQIFSAIWPLKLAHVGLNSYRYGFSGFNELEMGLTIARRFGKLFSLGIKLNYHQLKITNYGLTTRLSVDIGLGYKLDSLWSVGLHINRIGRKTFSENWRNPVDEIVSVGAGCQLSDKILIAATLHLTTTTKNLGFGMNYQLIPALALRFGLTTKPFKQYTGIGLTLKNLSLDLALEHDPMLTHKPQLGVTYAF